MSIIGNFANALYQKFSVSKRIFFIARNSKHIFFIARSRKRDKIKHIYHLGVRPFTVAPLPLLLSIPLWLWWLLESSVLWRIRTVISPVSFSPTIITNFRVHCGSVTHSTSSSTPSSAEPVECLCQFFSVCSWLGLSAAVVDALRVVGFLPDA